MATLGSKIPSSWKVLLKTSVSPSLPFCHAIRIRVNAPQCCRGTRAINSSCSRNVEGNLNEEAPPLLHHQKPWDIKVAVCLERLPVISPLKNELEEKFKNLQETLEIEHSVLSNLEVKWNEEVKKSKTKRKMTEKEEQITLEAERELGKMKEAEETVEDMKKTFPLAGRVTNDDDEGNKQSLNRLLDESLFLLVPHEKSQSGWSFPEGGLDMNENLRSAAERILKTTYGDDGNVTFLSNAPAGVVSTKYSPSSVEGGLLQGCKVFFYKASMGMHPKKTHLSENSLWLSINELQQYISVDYLKKLYRFL